MEAPAPSFSFTDLTLIFTAIIWGSNFILIKTAIREFLPLTFTALRFALASLAMVAVLAARQRRLRLSRGDWAWLTVLAVVANVGYQPLYVIGLSYTTTSNSSLILAFTPVLVAVQAHWLKLEHLELRSWAGIALSVAGLVLVIAGGRGESAEAPNPLLGNTLTFVAALAWAIGTVMMRRLVERLSPLLVSTLSNVLAVPLIFLVALPALAAQDWAAVSLSAWLQLAASGLLAISLAYVLWTRGVQRLGGSRTAIYANLIPVVATVAGVVFLGETVTLLQLLGAAGVLGGIALARLSN